MKPGETERLRFKSVSLDDARQLDALNNAPGVMRYLDRTPPSLDDLIDKIIPEKLRMAETWPGYGLWLAYLKSSNAFVGQFELKPNIADAEVGYRLLPDFWRQGLASEGSRELLRYAFDEIKVDRVIAVTMAVNEPSRRLMERIGLSYVRTFHEHFDDALPGTEKGEVEYAVTRGQWLLRGAQS